MPLVYTCPIIDCAWTHTDDGPAPLDPGATDDDQHAQAVLHQATIEHALRAHYETHDTETWVRTVSALHAELAARAAPLLCGPCVQASADHAARGQDAPPPLPAVTIAQGLALCNQRHRIIAQASAANQLLIPPSGHLPPLNGLGR